MRLRTNSEILILVKNTLNRIIVRVIVLLIGGEILNSSSSNLRGLIFKVGKVANYKFSTFIFETVEKSQAVTPSLVLSRSHISPI